MNVTKKLYQYSRWDYLLFPGKSDLYVFYFLGYKIYMFFLCLRRNKTNQTRKCVILNINIQILTQHFSQNLTQYFLIVEGKYHLCAFVKVTDDDRLGSYLYQ